MWNSQFHFITQSYFILKYYIPLSHNSDILHNSDMSPQYFDSIPIFLNDRFDTIDFL
jgi:hypothetical protein